VDGIGGNQGIPDRLLVLVERLDDQKPYAIQTV
jgi:hypothetical protein